MIDFVFDMGQTIDILTPALFFVIGVVIYSIFIFKFYRFLARKDIFKLNLQQYNYGQNLFMKKFLRVLLYIVEYIILFPVLTFFWFAVLALLLSLLAQNLDITSLLLVSMALVGAVRVTSYYSEDLSKDLAKMLPFALLGVFLVNINEFSYDAALDTISMIPENLIMIFYYLLFVIVLEFVLRIFHLMFGKKDKKGKLTSDEELVEE